MELTLNSRELAQAVSICASASAKKTAMPILYNVLLTAEDSKLYVRGTDGDLSIKMSVPAKIKSPGSITIKATLLNDVLRELPDTELKFSLGERGRVDITCAGAKVKLVGQAADEFPGLSGTALEPKGKIAARDIVEMINKTLYSTSPDETRIAIAGICFEYLAAEKSVTMVATDGHRLSLIKRKGLGFSSKTKVVLSKRSVTELKKILSAESELPVALDVQDGYLICETPTAKFAAKLVDADFPSYDKVVPAGSSSAASVNRKSFISSLRRAALLSPEKSKASKMHFNEGELTVTSLAPDIGEATEKLEIEYTGAPTTVGFNAQYLLEFCEACSDAETVRLELNGSTGAAKLCTDADESFFGVIMPMRLNDAA
jgi:DNA polymerase-3 subunit beta